MSSSTLFYGLPLRIVFIKCTMGSCVKHWNLTVVNVLVSSFFSYSLNALRSLYYSCHCFNILISKKCSRYTPQFIYYCIFYYGINLFVCTLDEISHFNTLMIFTLKCFSPSLSLKTVFHVSHLFWYHDLYFYVITKNLSSFLSYFLGYITLNFFCRFSRDIFL